jgi:hypothetical protein
VRVGMSITYLQEITSGCHRRRRGSQALWSRRAGLLLESAQVRGQRVDPGRLLLQSPDLPLLRNELLL